MESQPQPSTPEPAGSGSNPTQDATRMLKEYPALLVGLFKNPQSGIEALPTQGNWMQPLVYAGAAGLACGLINMLAMPYYFAIPMVVQGIFASLVAAFLGGAILNFVLATMSKDPGMYRTILLMSVLTGCSVIGAVGALAHPILSIAISAAGAYVIYHYAMVAAGCTKKQAGILVGIMVGLTVLSMGGLMGISYLARRPMMYPPQ